MTMKKYGYIEDQIQPQDYIYGGGMIEPDVLSEKSDWTKFLPIVEYQSRGNLETSNCTSYGTLNALETIFAAKYNIKVNLSERYIGKLAKTTPTGNSPHKIIEMTRKYVGAIPEEMLPFSNEINSWDEYYSGVNLSHIMVGLQWMWRWKVTHEWVPNDKETMYEALRYSPLGIAVQAWPRPENGVYYRQGADNHWCLLFKAHRNKYWYIYDTYDSTVKRLHWNYGFNRIKRYNIEHRQGVDIKTLGGMARGIVGLY